MARIENEPVAPVEAVDLTAAVDARAELPPEVLAQSLGEYLRGYWTRVRSGDSGVLPVVVGLVASPSSSRSSRPRTLPRPSNLVYLFSGEHHLHGPGDGRDLRAAARRDRPLHRLVMGLAAVVVWEWCSRPCPAARRAAQVPTARGGHGGRRSSSPCSSARASAPSRGAWWPGCKIPALVVTLGGSLLFGGVDLHHPRHRGPLLAHRRRFFNELAIYDIFKARFAPLVGWIAMVGGGGRGGGVALAARRRGGAARAGGPPGGAHGGPDRHDRRASGSRWSSICNINRAPSASSRGFP